STRTFPRSAPRSGWSSTAQESASSARHTAAWPRFRSAPPRASGCSRAANGTSRRCSRRWARWSRTSRRSRTCARRQSTGGAWPRTCCTASGSRPRASSQRRCTRMDARSSPEQRAATGAIAGGVGQAIPHDSSRLHVSGEALYTDDLPEPRGLLHVAVGLSAKPHARIRSLDLDRVRRAPGVVDVITADDVPGENNCGPVVHDDPILAPGLVEYAGQAVFAVAATSPMAARRAARLAQVDYEELETILDPLTALERQSFVLPTETIRRGDSRQALAGARHRLQGRVRCGGQDQFYLEGQVAMALPAEDGDLVVWSSTQHPGEVQQLVAAALGRQAKDVV